MAQTATNVSAAKPKVGGAIYIGSASATLPTSATGDLGTGWTALGYVSDDGLTNSNSPDTDIIHAWGGDPVLTLYNAREDTFQFKLIEVLNDEVLKAVYGSNNVTVGETGTTIQANNSPLATLPWVFDMVMRDGALKRIVVPSGQISDIGDIEYNDSDAVGYDITLSAQADTSGNTHYEYNVPATNG